MCIFCFIPQHYRSTTKVILFKLMLLHPNLIVGLKNAFYGTPQLYKLFQYFLKLDE